MIEGLSIANFFIFTMFDSKSNNPCDSFFQLIYLISTLKMY